MNKVFVTGVIEFIRPPFDKSKDSVTKITWNMDIDSEKASTSNNNDVNTKFGNNTASKNKNLSQPSGSQGQYLSHKPPPIAVDRCENLNGLIRSTDRIFDPSKYFLKCHHNNSVSIITAKVPFYSWLLKKEREISCCHPLCSSFHPGRKTLRIVLP